MSKVCVLNISAPNPPTFSVKSLLKIHLDIDLFRNEFKKITVYLLSQDPEVASCGYKALADFPEAVHTINLLPEAVRVPLSIT